MRHVGCWFVEKSGSLGEGGGDGASDYVRFESFRQGQGSRVKNRSADGGPTEATGTGRVPPPPPPPQRHSKTRSLSAPTDDRFVPQLEGSRGRVAANRDVAHRLISRYRPPAVPSRHRPATGRDRIGEERNVQAPDLNILIPSSASAQLHFIRQQLAAGTPSSAHNSRSGTVLA